MRAFLLDCAYATDVKMHIGTSGDGQTTLSGLTGLLTQVALGFKAAAIWSFSLRAGVTTAGCKHYK